MEGLLGREEVTVAAAGFFLVVIPKIRTQITKRVCASLLGK